MSRWILTLLTLLFTSNIVHAEDDLQNVMDNHFKQTDAEDLLSKAQQGDSVSQYMLGMKFIKEGKSQLGRAWVMKAADQNHRFAQMTVIKGYANKPQKAAELYIKYKAQKADVGLHILNEGYIQLIIDEMTKLAESGSLDAQYALGTTYVSSASIENPDPFYTGIRYLSDAASNGHILSQEFLQSLHYLYGHKYYTFREHFYGVEADE